MRETVCSRTPRTAPTNESNIAVGCVRPADDSDENIVCLTGIRYEF